MLQRFGGRERKARSFRGLDFGWEVLAFADLNFAPEVRSMTLRAALLLLTFGEEALFGLEGCSSCNASPSSYALKVGVARHEVEVLRVKGRSRET